MTSLKKIVHKNKIEWLTNQTVIKDDINESRLNSLFKHPIFKDIYSNSQYSDWYINYFEESVLLDDQKEKNYQDFNNRIKERIQNHLKLFNIQVSYKYIAYSTIVLEKTENMITYIIIYMAPERPISSLQISNKTIKDNYFLSLIKLNFKNEIMSADGNAIIENFAINEDYFIYCFFEKLETNGNTGILHCLKPFITFNESILSIDFKATAFYAEDVQNLSKRILNKAELLKMKNVPEINFVENNKKYKVICFADAREYNINHILIDSDKFKSSKLGQFIYSNKLIRKILLSLKIENEPVISKPTDVFLDLLKMNVEDKIIEVHIAIEESDYDFLINKNFVLEGQQINELDLLKKQIKNNFPWITLINYIFKKTPALEKDKLYLCITLKEYYKDHYIYSESKNLKKNSVQQIIANGKEIKNLDWYTQIKKEIFENNLSGNCETVTQGLVLRKDLPFFINNNKEVNKKNLIKKIVNELFIKSLLFKHRTFKINNCDFKSLKMFKKFAVKKTNGQIYVKYAYLSCSINKDLLTIKDAFLISEDCYENLLADYQIESISERGIYKSAFLILDDKYIIKVKNNVLNPIPIGNSQIWLDLNINPLYTKRRTISKIEKEDAKGNVIMKKGTLTNNLSKSFEDNHFVNYNITTVKNLIGSKVKIPYSYCLVEFKNKKVDYFCVDKNNIKLTIPKINRMESLSLYEYKDFEINQLNFENNKNILEFYLGLTTDDIININSYSKSTILEKMLNILWDN